MELPSLSSRLRIRVDEGVKDLVRKGSKIRGFSENEFVIQAIKHFVVCKAETVKALDFQGPGLKSIITKYEGKCIKCRNYIPTGSQAWYGRREKGSPPILVCLDCMMFGMADKTLAKKFIKVKELQATIRGLNKMANELAEAVFDPDILKRQEQFQSLVSNAVERYEKYLQVGTPGEEKKLLEEVLHTVKEAQRIEKGLDDFLYMQIQKLQKRKKKQKLA